MAEESIKEMIEAKPVDYRQLIFLEILKTSEALIEGGERAERAVLQLRPLLAVFSDATYKDAWKVRAIKLQELRGKYKTVFDKAKYDREMFPVLLEEFEALLDMAARNNFFGYGKPLKEDID